MARSPPPSKVYHSRHQAASPLPLINRMIPPPPPPPLLPTVLPHPHLKTFIVYLPSSRLNSLKQLINSSDHLFILAHFIFAYLILGSSHPRFISSSVHFIIIGSFHHHRFISSSSVHLFLVAHHQSLFNSFSYALPLPSSPPSLVSFIRCLGSRDCPFSVLLPLTLTPLCSIFIISCAGPHPLFCPPSVSF